MMFHPLSSMDFLPQDKLRAIQTERLINIVGRAYERVELFRNRLDENGVSPMDIQSIDDIAKLPFMVKADLRDTYPFGLFASPMSDIVRLHASSGTTGKPIVVAYTQADLDVWSETVMRAFLAYGMTKGDVLQNCYGYGLFTGGLGAHQGGEALGATVLPVSTGNSARQLMLMKDFGVTAICCTPSFFLHLLDTAGEQGVDVRQLPLKIGAFGAEPWSEAMRQKIEELSGIKAYDIYGLSEIVGPGVGGECQCQNGLHIFEDHYYPEIIDPETLEVLPDGEEGELVLTTLSKQAMPIIRYRTRDITKIIPERCECGRTLRRIARISRRSDDMLIIRGVNVFPSQIETAILSIEGVAPYYEIIVTRDDNLDRMEVKVEITDALLGDDTIKTLETLQKRITAAIERIINIRVKVTLVEPRTLERFDGKAKRVKDLRKI
ncbi:MAG: phenylacetate--CoA ligase [Thermoguttaceae bacterium]|nr:phenylacetate--CoA ligase [Thermoguttaceae bacterium]